MLSRPGRRRRRGSGRCTGRRLPVHLVGSGLPAPRRPGSRKPGPRTRAGAESSRPPPRSRPSGAGRGLGAPARDHSVGACASSSMGGGWNPS
jgi:hypothetical protein